MCEAGAQSGREGQREGKQPRNCHAHRQPAQTAHFTPHHGDVGHAVVKRQHVYNESPKNAQEKAACAAKTQAEWRPAVGSNVQTRFKRTWCVFSSPLVSETHSNSIVACSAAAAVRECVRRCHKLMSNG